MPSGIFNYAMRYTCCVIYESYAETKGSDDSDCRAALIAEFAGSEGEFFAGGRVLEGDAQGMQVQSMRWVAGGVARQSADTIACRGACRVR